MNSQRLTAFTVSLIALGTIVSVVTDIIRAGWFPGYSVAIGLSLFTVVILVAWRITDKYSKF